MYTAPAQAQRARDFVASYGSDSASCGAFLSPCRTFQQAVTNVAAGGEVTAIDSAGFQPVVINKSVSIVGPVGIEAGVVATTGIAIHITAATTDTVSLRGLTLEGNGTASQGIQVDSVGQLEIIDCVVRDFVGNGIYVASGTTASLNFIISNTLTSKNAYGILVHPFNNQNTNGTMEKVRAINNQYGIYVYGGSMTIGGSLDIAISDSVVSSNSQNGIVFLTSSVKTVGSVQNSTVANNHVGISVGASNNVAKTAGVGVQSSIITTNFEGLFTSDGGTITLSRSMLAYNTFDQQASCASICQGGVESTGDNGEANTGTTSFNPVPYH
jgi:hypothetical protein